MQQERSQDYLEMQIQAYSLTKISVLLICSLLMLGCSPRAVSNTTNATVEADASVTTSTSQSTNPAQVATASTATVVPSTATPSRTALLPTLTAVPDIFSDNTSEIFTTEPTWPPSATTMSEAGSGQFTYLLLSEPWDSSISGTSIWFGLGNSFSQSNLIHTTSETISQVRWSPNCSQLLFNIIGNPGEESIWLANVNGKQIELPTYLVDGTNFSWSPDGLSIAFDKATDGASQIYVYDFQTQATTQLTSDGNNYQPDWSPDSSQITFTSKRGTATGNTIYVMNLDGSDQRALLPPEWGEGSWENPYRFYPTSPSWSPDGLNIAFSVEEDAFDRVANKIYVLSLDGSPIRQVSRGDNRNDSPSSEDFYYRSELDPRWLPDNQQISYLRENAFDHIDTNICTTNLENGVTTCSAFTNERPLSIDWCFAKEN